MDWGMVGPWVGGIAGGTIGMMGGLVGTYFSIKNTQGPRERALMIKAAVYCWIFIALFLAGMLLLPHRYNLLLVIPYLAVLVWGIRKLNATQLRIRNEEASAGS